MGVIGEEVAKAELKRIEDYYCIELEPEQKKIALRAIRAGKLSFDESEELFTIYLSKPVTLDNGDVIEKVELKEFSIEQYKEAFKPGRSEIDATVHLLSAIMEKPVGVINRFKMRDITIAGTVLVFFG